MKQAKKHYLLATLFGTAILFGGISTRAESFVAIYNLQGSGSESSYAGTNVMTEGVVTGIFPNLGGCFIQDQTGDGKSSTSDGIWVDGVTSYNVGTKLALSGKIRESFNRTELTKTDTISVTGSGITIAPTPVQLPADLEPYEGMLVTFKQKLTVTENYNLHRYGQLTLAANGTLIQPTDRIDPNDQPTSGVNYSGTSNVTAVTAAQTLNNQRLVLLDDGSSSQNPATNPYWDSNYTCRIGSTLKNLTGCLDYAYSYYRVEPTKNVKIKYASRPTGLAKLGSYNLKVSSFNVLNYFNGDGTGAGFPTSRGASTYAEFLRQRAKIVAAMRMINADVFGLLEIESDGSDRLSAIADLTTALNEAYGCAIYAYITDPAFIGTDAIKCGIIYKKTVVTPQGAAVSDTSSVHSRPPVAQTFMLNCNSRRFTFMVNHLKSKSTSGASGADADQKDGQGGYNATRRSQSQAIVEFANRLSTSTSIKDQIILGDWNAYSQEDPVDVMRAAGFIALPEDDYSYAYSNQVGALDHIFISASLVKQLTGNQILHINAAEPRLLDYTTDYNPTAAYQPNAYRSSDHDPAIAAFRLGK